ncbi:hypothetical protein chiPu_0024452 [Chiloscyllium punctatum]|uniref:Uncharacterized protein n=1 Tax=Chiloscyllium punctatum TaxID=137246 RepID=A0A401TCF6_CHIPU|nr:hypothetical protein [Chiloscyllium punctatum]
MWGERTGQAPGTGIRDVGGENGPGPGIRSASAPNDEPTNASRGDPFARHSAPHRPGGLGSGACSKRGDRLCRYGEFA